MDVSTGVASADQRATLLALYESGVREVYGYLVHRCGASALAEDLTNGGWRLAWIKPAEDIEFRIDVDSERFLVLREGQGDRGGRGVQPNHGGLGAF